MKSRFETIKYGITRNDSMKSWRDVVQGLLTDRKERTETVGMLESYTVFLSGPTGLHISLRLV